MNPTLKDLLSPRATIIQVTRRASFEKRIVEFNDAKYVLYSFPNRQLARRFTQILNNRDANTGLQRIAASSTSKLPGWLGSNWVALHYETGEQIPNKNIDPAIFSSLGQALARLHRLRNNTRAHLLIPPWHDVSGAYSSLMQTVEPAQAKWLEDSQQRLGKITEFSLTHGDLHPKNIIVTPSVQAVLIDYEFLAYDLAGIELGTLLLRPFCRTEKNRTNLLQAYLANCDEITCQLWQTHWPDFLVAAAVRISAQRDRRHRIISQRHKRLSLFGKLPLPQSFQARITSQQSTQAETIRRTADGSKLHLEIASKLVSLICEGGVSDSSTLVTECFRKPTTKN
ncbi:phosphotransferase [uncultured Azonexus sp.]|uniref:phosphotransferase n=1 Tax=uncultured Azonexus sp. TaxID=520307 RepID=UPI002639B5FA|nr:phosphotransferase [uncultured Azonexus sp.]